MAYDLIAPSDRLVTQLAVQTDKNSDYLIVYQIIFVILVVGILILILHLVARILKLIFFLTQATSKIKKGNFDVSIIPKGSDELSLAESFNSMTASMGELIKNRTKLEAANEELKRLFTTLKRLVRGNFHIRILAFVIIIVFIEIIYFRSYRLAVYLSYLNLIA